MSAISDLNVLLVEDNPGDALLVSNSLTTARDVHVIVHHAARLSDAAEHLRLGKVDVVLVDLGLPDANHLEAVTLLQGINPRAAILVLSGNSDSTLALEAVQAGAQDYLVKRPRDAESLVRRIRFALERKRMEFDLAMSAIHDSLTGLPNRACFIKSLNQALSRAQRTESTVALLFLDLDKFKPVNDRHGHDFGDRLLCDFSRRLLTCARAGDTVCRIGGDEFTVILEELAGSGGAIAAARRIIETCHDAYHIKAKSISITPSIGIAMFPTHARDSDNLVTLADRAMYEAKRLSTGIHMCEKMVA